MAAALKCPKCGSARIHRSHRRTLQERTAWIVGIKTRRCHECNFRFAQGWAKVMRPAEFRLLIRKAGWAGITMLALAAVLLIVILFSYGQNVQVSSVSYQQQSSGSYLQT
jgi:hypothetical protein